MTKTRWQQVQVKTQFLQKWPGRFSNTLFFGLVVCPPSRLFSVSVNRCNYRPDWSSLGKLSRDVCVFLLSACMCVCMRV